MFFSAKRIEDQIDNYVETIYAIIGFINFYRYDSINKRIDASVKVFQGRKFTIKNSKQDVSPDLGIMYTENSGLLGEVKHCFPENKNLWFSTFEQIMNYDKELIGWPCPFEKIDNYDIVLLVHYSRSRDVKKYLEDNLNKKFFFNRPFILIEYLRVNQREEYRSFRIEYGKLSHKRVNEQLSSGVQVKMFDLLEEYSTIKIYDGQPPIAYLLFLIWMHCISHKASEDQNFVNLRKNQKIEVKLSLEEICKELNEGFSFNRFHKEFPNRQPEIPKKEWVIIACDKLISIGDGRWEDKTKGLIIMYFRKLDDSLNYFINKCSDEDLSTIQQKLFDDTDK